MNELPIHSNSLMSSLKKLIRRIGVDVHRYQKQYKSKGFSYQTIYPNCFYSPWLDDAAFMSLFEKIYSYTLLDAYRLYSLVELVAQFSSSTTVALEVGSWRGGSAAAISLGISRSSQGISELIVADTFQGVVKAGSEYDGYYTGGEHSDTSKEQLIRCFNECGYKLPRIIEGVFPDVLNGEEFEKGISFLHCDVDAYVSTKDIIEWALPRLSPRCAIVFDDYGFQNAEGVTQFCNSLRKEHEFVFVHNLNGQALFVRS